jgi:uncharacterized protein (DUF1697 family)
MAVMVALLRGVNVGGRTTLPMAELRRVAADLGYGDVATYIQSGNLVLRTSDSAATVERELARAVAALGGVAPAVMVRTRSQLAKLIAGNPFVKRGEDPAVCHLAFGQKSAAGALRPVDLDSYAPEEAMASGKDLYLFLPGGVGRSKLAAALAKNKDAVGTVRNWRTVTKLLELADGA